MSNTLVQKSHVGTDVQMVCVLAGTPRNSPRFTKLEVSAPYLPLGDGSCALTRIAKAVQGNNRLGHIENIEVLASGRVKPDDSYRMNDILRTRLDDSDYRGSAGVLRDATVGELEPDARVLVFMGTEVFDSDRLGALLDKMLNTSGDVVLARDRSDRPIGVMLVRVSCLQEVSAVGYCDLKEQLLPRLAKRRDVKVVTWDRSVYPDSVWWLRDERAYLEAVAKRRSMLRHDGWEPLVMPGAWVSPDAVVQSSVILPGARVEAGAVVARSIVGAGVTVAASDVAIDEVLTQGQGE